MYRAVQTFCLNYEDNQLMSTRTYSHLFWDSYKIFSDWRSAV